MKIISIPNSNWKLPSEVKDGEICIVREWPPTPNWAYINGAVGKLLQRYGDKFIVLGEHSGKSYSDLIDSDDVRLEVLPKGTIINL